jgi:uncharacterized repeat protein (TIGR03803 family)
MPVIIMKLHAKDQLLLLMITGLILMTSGRAAAQTFSNLYSFSETSNSAPYGNSDGAFPASVLVLSGDTLYGTTSAGGIGGNGTVFAIKTNGLGFTNLYSFSAFTNSSSTNSDGAFPNAGLILSGDFLYGTTSYGGASDLGTVFGIKTNGNGFTNLHSFTGRKATGANPYSGLVLSGNALYGTGLSGGSLGAGIVYMIYTNGSGFTNLHSLDGGADEYQPQGGLDLIGNALYGTTDYGGQDTNGAVFVIETNGMGFTNIYSFTGSNDGSVPAAGLILSNSTLYGTAQYGGTSNGAAGFGTVFSLNTNGAPFRVLHTFTTTGNVYGTNGDGANPIAGLILSGNTLYGAAVYGGSRSYGTLFSVDTVTSNFTTLHSFDETNDGGNPRAGLLLAGNALYGTAQSFGSGGTGTVFRLLLGSVSASQPDIVSVSSSGTNLVINASNGQSGQTYTTLTSANLSLPPSQWTPVATNVLAASGNFTIILSGAVTLNGGQRFFILQTQ